MTPREVIQYIETHQDEPTSWMLDPELLLDEVEIINEAEGVKYERTTRHN